MIVNRDFKECLAKGEKAEALIALKYKAIRVPLIQRFFYERSGDERFLQQNGVDAAIEMLDTAFDVKARHNRYHKDKDILIETVSINETNKIGWFYNSKTKAIIYVWWDLDETYFVDGYIIFMDDFRKWYAENEFEYLFCWNDIPGTDSEKLIYFIRNELNVDWVKTEHIERIKAGFTINVSDKRNSVSFVINSVKNIIEVTLDGGWRYDLILKQEKGKLNVYKYRYEIEIAGSENEGVEWTTNNRPVPICDIPEYFMYRMSKSDLHLPDEDNQVTKNLIELNEKQKKIELKKSM